MVNGASCAPVTDYSGYANRQIAADGTANDFYGTCDGTCNDVPVAPAVDVTFQGDMSQYQGTYGTVNINGSFNGWCGACATMTDDDGDGVYTSPSNCHRRPTNTNSLWTVGRPKKNSQKAMCARAPSTVTPWRTLDVTEATTLDAVCYNSLLCPGRAPERSITFRVNMSERRPTPSAFFIAGTFKGWSAGSTAMTDDDGDDIWEYTAMIAEGEAVEYKFINGQRGSG